MVYKDFPGSEIPEDIVFMKEALKLAKKRIGKTSPNPTVGAVVVRDGIVVGRGFHEAPGKPHAEVEALLNAGEKARGATLYVTLEPCNHYGRTPPCTEAVLKAGIKRVVVGIKDPNPAVKGGGCERLASENIQVVTGVLEKECYFINRFFFKHVTTGLPYVIVKGAMTLDGRIASRTGHSKWITGEKARRFARKIRCEVDAVCVGIGTVMADNPILTARRKSCKDPIRVVADTTLRIPEDSFIVESAKDCPLWIFHGEKVESSKISRLRKKGVTLFQVPIYSTADGGKLDLEEILKVLGQENITSLLVEGGAEMLGSFFSYHASKALVDEVCFFYAPKILADDRAYPLIRNGRECCLIDEALVLSDVQVKRLGNDIMIRGFL